MTGKGCWALVLHAHLPYVRHPEKPEYMEERWLFEALTECYLPLTESWLRLRQEQVPFQVTFSVTPSLAAMLTDSLLQQRYLRYLDKMLTLAAQEQERTEGDKDFAPLAAMYREKLETCQRLFRDDWSGRITDAWRSLAESGHLDLWTSAATHAFLPYASEGSWRPQIRTGINQHKAIFGMAPHGFWLPECAYAPGVEKVLAQEGVCCFVVDNGTFQRALPEPASFYQPLQIGHQVSAFARDPETSHQVWDKKSGYPGDYDYREFYRDIGYDLPFATVAPYLDTDVPADTGFKYYRITGNTDHKEPYRPDWAMGKVNAHADNFVRNRCAQVEHLSKTMAEPPIVLSPYDAELFGHWWYEGPAFLEAVLRRMAAPDSLVVASTPRRYREAHGPGPAGRIAFSTWGEDGFGKVWLSEQNDWIYRHLHRAEKEMVALAQAFPVAEGETGRALNQAARELMLAQSSDWPFIMYTGTTVEYVTRRLNEHLRLFWSLARSLREGKVDEASLTEAQWKHPLFAEIDYHDYVRFNRPSAPAAPFVQTEPVWMLTWEYPPRVVGGLGRAVADLSKALVAQGVPVTVFTCAVPGCAERETVDGVTIIRLPVPGAPQEADFLDWVYRFNMALVSGVMAETAAGLPAVIHAHDWLVGLAAREIRKQTDIPLAVTIHATEHGRQRGLWNDLQRSIHRAEAELVAAADGLIACSDYMTREVSFLFDAPWNEICTIPNGVDPANVAPVPGEGKPLEAFCQPGEEIIFHVGRLVTEKGAPVLVEAMPSVLRRRPQARLIIAGKGPLLESLKGRAAALGVSERITFAGFVDDNTRNRLLTSAEAAVFPSLYEPFGIVALEAMAAGTPVIVGDAGGLGEIIRHGENGLKVPPGDAEALADAIVRVLADRDGAAAMVREALREVDEIYGWDTVAEQTVCLYRQATIKRLTAGAVTEAAS
ncbi:DUF1957 domain-containing protein [Heliobacterium gestii]|uniref:DUF1957 domain-containing protein n=1 Tax=Heliomicrobium gestii TaxID=2699 RepID=A0A845LHP8_HELGE|nr:1,4-alpha-glucan branching protein domain-containing protein [Heliomicrobium gestii]MBM7867507.1 1,4-alpha-glucan branching enzyme [Heliomicrobium gestii]MZP43945.1 DUF1957 domain-containing protein [Heliomicrobium gestii]